LGYLRLGHPLNTLSGGESQRLKLVRPLTDTAVVAGVSPANKNRAAGTAASTEDTVGNFFIFDEPTTGLHFDDVAVLLRLFQRLIDAGYSLVVIEHNLEVIKCADWIIDLGPEAGDEGGEVVAVGTPERVAKVEHSHTGRFLRTQLGSARFQRAALGILPSESGTRQDAAFGPQDAGAPIYWELPRAAEDSPRYGG